MGFKFFLNVPQFLNYYYLFSCYFQVVYLLDSKIYWQDEPVFIIIFNFLN